VRVSPRILVVQHEDDDPIHLMGSWMGDVDLVVCRAFDGESPPTTPDGYDGLVVMGGAMGANDDATTPWLTPTKELIRRAAADRVPTLGICLGHQLAAVALGGEVRPNPRGRQFGLLDVGWDPAAHLDELFAPVATPRRAVQWNDDVVTRPPDGARVLARAATGEVQAARFAASVWGVQWHPEVDEPLVRTWTADGGVDPDEAERALAAIAGAAADLEQAWRPLAVRFAELVSARQGAGSRP
jgi:GMP synthase (glutamine-hydrolysing)